MAGERMILFAPSAFSLFFNNKKLTRAKLTVSTNGIDTTHYGQSLFSLNFGISLSESPRKRIRFSQLCSKKSHADHLFEGFDETRLEVPWRENDIWSTFIGYLFVLHIPLSFGGLSIIYSFLQKPTLDPQSIVISTAILQSIELVGALSLLQYSAKPNCDFYSFLFGNILLPKRNWVKKTVLAVGFLIALVSLSSILADKFMGPKDVNDPMIKEILSQGQVSQFILFYLYCINAPILEEIVYRGFLLSSLRSKSKTKTWEAIILSSCMFSLAHFNFENSLQLFIIGCVLGFVYCWSGTLVSPIIVHSIYNAMILVNAISSIV